MNRYPNKSASLLSRTLMLGAFLLLLSGCATRLQPGISSNPPPKQALGGAAYYTLAPLKVGDDIAQREPNVVRWVQEKIDAQVGPTIRSWNSAKKSQGTRLVITPKIDKLKFISTGERILGGAMVGGSAIQTSFEIRNEQSGELIAQPIFYQHANAFGSSYSYGSTDRAMLDRVVELMNTYLVNNYDAAVGGATGDES